MSQRQKLPLEWSIFMALELDDRGLFSLMYFSEFRTRPPGKLPWRFFFACKRQASYNNQSNPWGI